MPSRKKKRKVSNVFECIKKQDIDSKYKLAVGNAKFGFTEYINRLFIFLSLFSVNLDTAKIISEVLRVFVKGNRSSIS